ncbi:MAG: dihydrofolate reductase [Treponema sp.]|jgi:dihydrofolate reductase|nr:dihydrofolate reductase [Treponema sp.]
MEIIIIAAMSENRVIGAGNALPWALKTPPQAGEPQAGEPQAGASLALKADMDRFKKTTLGWPCVMGRKTWESLPKRPLPGRPNIVISKSLNAAEGAKVFSSLREAIGRLAGYEKVFICGGASVYGEALGIAGRIELTVIHRHYEGDVFFPEIDPALWEITNTEDFDGLSFISYNRIGGTQ